MATTTEYPEVSRIAEAEKELFPEEAPALDGGDNLIETPAPELTPTPETAPVEETVTEPVKPAGEPENVTESEQVQQLKAELEKANQRYNSFKGAVDASGPRQAEEIRVLREQLAEVQTNQAKLAKGTEEPPATADPSTFKAKLVEAGVDEDLANILDQMVETKAGSEAKIAPVRQTLEQQRQLEYEKARAAFHGELAAADPNWAETVKTPEWHSWLDEMGIPPEAVTFVDQRMDGKRGATWLKNFNKTKAPAITPPPAKKPDPESDAQRAALKAQAAPRTASLPSGDAPAKRRYTVPQYHAFRAKVMSGQYDPKDEAKLKQELDDMVLEGRVDGL